MDKKQNCVIWIQELPSLYTQKQMEFKGIAEVAETRFDTSNYELHRGELGGKIMTKRVVLRAKTYSYLIDDGSKDKSKRLKKKCHKRT